jgi:hypothetical protein
VISVIWLNCYWFILFIFISHKIYETGEQLLACHDRSKFMVSIFGDINEPFRKDELKYRSHRMWQQTATALPRLCPPHDILCKNKKYNLLIYISQSSLTVFAYNNRVIFFTYQVWYIAYDEVFNSFVDEVFSSLVDVR